VARWAAFLGLTAVVLTLLLALARLSSTAVREPTPALPASDDADPGAEPGPDPDLDPAPLGEGPGVPGEGTEQPGAPEGPGAPSSAMGTGALLANVALTQGLFGFLVAGGAWYFGIPAGALGLDPPVSAGALAVGVGFGLVLWVGNELAASVADAVGAAYDERLRGMLAPDSAAGWALLLGVVLPVVAVVEEFIFRAALIGAPAAGFGVSAWALAVVSSAAFALGHGAQGRVGIAVTGGLGLVLAVGYVLTGSLAVVVVAHYLVNALEFLVHELFGWPRLL
jgi:membrane protease YdiL (CAAX protease family)